MKAGVFLYTDSFCPNSKIKLVAFLFFTLFMSLNMDEVLAEGSGDWGTATNRQSMLWVAGTNATSGLTARGSMMVPTNTTGYNAGHRLYVYVKEGETVFWGFRRSGSTGNIRVRWYYDATSTGFFPQGTAGASRTFIGGNEINPSAAGGGTGRPENALAAEQGPSQVTGLGYTGLTFTNNTGADRAFWVEISGTNDLIIPSGFNINFWDITVASGSPGNYTKRNGRVYCRYWSVANSRSNATQDNLMIVEKGEPDAYSFHEDFGFYVPIDNTFTPASNDYFIKRIRFPGSSGGWTNFFANQDGPRNNLSYEENRRSINTASQNNFQYPLFINDPDPSVWQTTAPPTATLDIIYREKAPPSTGGEANVNINISLPAIVDILIDINGNGEFDSNEDVIISQIYESPGNYTVYWNGEDANGIELPSGGEVNFIASVAFFPVHFPIFDLEQCLGIYVDNVRPGDPGRDFIFWDDSLIPRTGIIPSDSPQSIEVNVTGVESPDHIWWATGDNGFSNNKTINTWTASFYRVVQRTSGFTFLSISGNVFEDLNAMTDDLVNGPGVDIDDFYAVLVNDQNNVVSFAAIQPDGTYTINDVPNGTFSIFLTTELPTNGEIAPALVLPLYYENTGEILGTGTGNDGIVDGILNNIVINNASISNANFGIRPINYDLAAIKLVKEEDIKPKIGDEITFIITVENLQYSSVGEVFLDEFMPSGFQYLRHSVTKGTFDSQSIPMRWDIGELAYGEMATLEITVSILQMLGTNIYNNRVRVYSESGIPEDNLDNNESSIDTEPFINLPVDWLSFEGKITETNQALLKWSTAKERDSEKFIIQRSKNANSWVNLGSLAAQGDTDDVSHYEYVDEQPMAGNNYYRLEQVDFDGKTNLSKVIRVDFNPSWSVKVYPNPFTDEIFIQTKNLGEINVSMMDTYGRTIFSNSNNVEDYSFRFDTKELQNGLYYLKIHRGGENFIYKLKK